MKHLLYIISLTLTLLMAACYPRGDDDSVMGLGEKLVEKNYSSGHTPAMIVHMI